MLYWYSQRHVHEIFIFITIRQREAMLMIIIARSPGNRSFTSTLIYNTASQRLFNTEGRGKNPKKLMNTSSLHHRGTTGTCIFLVLILDAKIPKFTYVQLTSSQGTVDLNMYKGPFIYTVTGGPGGFSLLETFSS